LRDCLIVLVILGVVNNSMSNADSKIDEQAAKTLVEQQQKVIDFIMEHLDLIIENPKEFIVELLDNSLKEEGTQVLKDSILPRM